MHFSHSRAFTSVALLCAASAGTACGGSSPETSDRASIPAPGRADDGPKAPAVNGSPDASELTEALGVFVAPSGRAGNDGTRERPLDTIQAGIDLGKRVGKRVYVCSGTFRESLVLADSISIIGALECGVGHWKLGGAPSRIEAPASPAVRAKNIGSATRLQGLDIVAPNAAQPSASSIGLLADHAAGLVIASSKITAGNGADGANGTEGTQLVQAGAVDGTETVASERCVGNACKAIVVVGGGFEYARPAGGVGGTSVCAGAPGHAGQSGGGGGSGGLWVSLNDQWIYYRAMASFSPTYGEDRPRTPAAAGTSGTPSAALGALSGEGYAAADGVSGTDGAPGFGGFGGRGNGVMGAAASAVPLADVWRGSGGPGGGAGGCPGLAGTAGTGGGASIALALVDSPLVVDDTQLVAAKAGAAGLGSFGSDPTAGGNAGAELTNDPVAVARGGGSGGLPGISTNGGNGPSVAVLHVGAAAQIRGGAKLTPGQAAHAIDGRSHTDALGHTRTIPATPAGVAKDILAL